MNEHLGREARELINRARREEAVADMDELQRIRRRVLSAASGSALLGTIGKALAVDGVGRLGISSLLKAGLLGSGTGAMAIGVTLILASPAASPDGPRAQRAPVASHAPATRTRVVEPVPAPSPNDSATRAFELEQAERTAAQSGPAKAGTPHERRLHAPTAPRANTKAGTDAETLGPELALLERVQAELRAGNGEQALELLDETPLDVEHSQLRAERLAAEVFAACQAGDQTRARRVMNRFLHDYPNSPSTARVRASCAGAESAE